MDIKEVADALGPAKVLQLWEPQLKMRAVVVVDSTACGPSIGGIRMAADATALEAFRLARAMTLKNAGAGLPHGGGKSVIVGDPHMPAARKEAWLRAFARAIATELDYIPGPDMGTDETCMGWIHDEIGRALGLPRELGGIPLDEIGATGRGLRACAEAACPHAGLELRGARVAIQGFGAVGLHAARFLAEAGAVIVGVADSAGATLGPDGLDVAGLVAHKRGGGKVADFPGGRAADADALIDVSCDIWIPAARPDVIDTCNVDRLRARLVLCGANIPVTEAAERRLHARGVLVVPDFIANAGGVICAAVEHRRGSEGDAVKAIEEKITANTRAVLDASRSRGLLPREAATALARERIERAMALRRFAHAAAA